MTPARAIRLAMMGGVLLFGGVSGILSVRVAAEPGADISPMSSLVVAAAAGMLRNPPGPRDLRGAVSARAGRRRLAARRRGGET